MFIIKHKKIFIGISITLVLLSFVLLFTLGLRVGIDFKGGALTEVVYEVDRPAQAELEEGLKGSSFGSVLLQPTGEKVYIVKTLDSTEAEDI